MHAITRARSRRLTVAWMVIASTVHAVRADAQAPSPSPSLVGQTIDASTGRALGGVTLRALGPDTITAITDADGRFSLGLRVGAAYQLYARRVGFAPYRTAVSARATDTQPRREPRLLRLDPLALTLDQVVVTAARREQKLADAVQSIEVISRAEITRSGASDLASVLTEQTGISLQGGHPAGTGVVLQGIGSERVLVLLDGQPLSGRLSGVFDLSRIPTSMIERVEVVKGPQSTLYGTDAMGGVINVITRRGSAAAWDASVVTTAGTQARRDASASLSHSSHGVSAVIDAGHRSTNTTPGIASANGALAARTDVSARVHGGSDSLHAFDASVLVLDERQRWRTSTFYNFGDNRQVTGRVSGSWRLGRHRLTPTLSTSQHDHLSRASMESQPFADDTGSRQVQRIHQAELLYRGAFGRAGSQLLDIGTQVRRDETQSVRVPGGLRSLTVVEPFAQLEFNTGPWSLSPGVRLTSSTMWGNNVTGRVASRLKVNERLTVRAAAGEGFRAPDFKELFMFFQNTGAGYAVYGNPDLQPESSRNVTVAGEWVAPRQYLRVQFFANAFRDFIETRPIGAVGEPPVYAYGNVDRGYTRGVDVESGLSISGVRAEASYSGLNTHDEATGQPLLGRPTHSARATVQSMLPGQLRTSLTALYTGRTPMERDDATGIITSHRDAFARVDLRLARSLGGGRGARGVELALGIDNLFNRQPASWAGFTGRQLFTTLSWNLQPASRP